MSKYVKSLGVAMLAYGCVMAVAGQDSEIKKSDFTSEAWAKGNITVTADATAAPDGTTTACKAAITTTAPATLIQSITATATTNTYTIYTKKGNLTTARFLMRNGTTNIDFTSGTLDYDSGVITGSGWTVEKLPNGWFKLKYTNSDTETINLGNIIMLYAGYVGAPYNAGDYIYVWGAQLESGK